MSFRRLRLATQFLTRLPVPAVEDFSPRELSSSAAWFPLVGAVIGILVALVQYLCSLHTPLLGAALAVFAWVWLTGALHLDGLADLADALAASHRDSARFLTVLEDPRVGTFGVVSVVLLLLVKFACLGTLSSTASGALTTMTSKMLLCLPLVCAWARLGPLAWSRWLQPLKAGQGKRFAGPLHGGWIIFWAVLLLAASAVIAPQLCVAPLLIAGWGVWLKLRLGGMTGDCLGAGIEVTEAGLLLALAVTSDVTAVLP